MIPIRDDQEAAHLVAAIELLLENADQETAQVPRRDPRARVGRPQVSVSPAAGLVLRPVRGQGLQNPRDQLIGGWIRISVEKNSSLYPVQSADAPQSTAIPPTQ